MDAVTWDARYTGSGLVWGAAPNLFVVAEFQGSPPGRALDIACGEGRNAIWLATRGWQATGIDFSPVGLDRAAELAADAGVADRVDFVVGDVVAGPLPPGPFDAVIVAYLQLPAPQRRAALRRAAQVVAPGGTLLVVGHDTTNLADGAGGPQDPAVLFTPEEVQADLADLPDLIAEKAGRVRRPMATSDGERVAVDALVRVRRTTGERSGR